MKISLKEDNRKYFGQQCQDDEINKKFRELHKKIVDEIILFCKENNIEIDEFYLSADCLEESIKYGSWQACTDSSLVFNKFTDEYKYVMCMEKNVSKEEFEKIKLDQESFMYSM